MNQQDQHTEELELDLGVLTLGELFGLTRDVLNELVGRGIIRSGGRLVGDYAETLFGQRYPSFKRMPTSFSDYDFEDDDGYTYQIKARRLPGNKVAPSTMDAVKMGGIKGKLLDDPPPFNFLIVIIFDDVLDVVRAAAIHVEAVRAFARPHAKNGYEVIMTNRIWNDSRVIDITDELSETSAVMRSARPSG